MALRPAAQWAIALGSLLAGGALLGLVLRIGVGTGLFLAGVAPIFASLGYIRLGGPRTRVGRSIDGTPLWSVDPAKRKAEIRKGVAIFALGLSVWAILMVGYSLGVVQ